MKQQRILVVDDEKKIRDLLAAYLRADGFEVAEAKDGSEALAKIRNAKPDLVILDVMMPGMDGIEVLRELRKTSDVFVMMLTARAEETDKLIGLSVGADDYLAKPFSPRELVARVKAILRRGRERAVAEEEVLRFDDLTVDLARREVTRGDRTCDLTALEFDLLGALTSAPGRVFTRRQLVERVWGWDFFGDERVVDVHIRNLRKALGDDASDPQVIGTVRGVGYKLVADRR
jgi:DNA-binding response OmpR family regulator